MIFATNFIIVALLCSMQSSGVIISFVYTFQCDYIVWSPEIYFAFPVGQLFELLRLVRSDNFS